MPVSTYSKPTGNNYPFFIWPKFSFFSSFLGVIVIGTVFIIQISEFQGTVEVTELNPSI